MLVHAKTGTGKTACYAIPVLQSVLSKKKGASFKSHVSVVVLVPTKELSRQVKGQFELLCRYCREDVQVVELAAQAETVKEQKALLRDKPDIVVATPARAWGRIQDGSLDSSRVSVLVIDEADLVLGYGYKEDVVNVLKVSWGNLLLRFDVLLKEPSLFSTDVFDVCHAWRRGANPAEGSHEPSSCTAA